MRAELLEAFFERLPALDAVLRAAGMARGPDSWQAVHDLMLRLAERGRLPAEPMSLAAYLGPILCRSPEEQARFAPLFRAWVTGEPPASEVRITTPEQARAARWRERLRALDRRWLVIAALVSVSLIGLAIYASRPPPVPPAMAPVSEVPEPPPAPPEPPVENAKIPIDKRVAPRRLPIPLAPEQAARLHVIAWSLPAVPPLLASLWLVWVYRRRAVLRREPPERESLLNRLAFRAPQGSLFGGAAADGVLPGMKAARWLPTRRLDIPATVESSARHGGYFEPRYRSRRMLPEYIVLVRGEHTEDQGAALAEELVRWLDEGGVMVQGFRFRDDPRHLIPWIKAPGRHATLSQLAARHPEARLIVVGDVDVAFHPLTGRPHRWIDDFKDWSSRAWLTPGEPRGGFAQWFLERGFLLLTLASADLEHLSHWLASPDKRRSVPATDSLPALPPAFADMPERWLDPQAPYGEDLDAVFDGLCDYLGPEGLRLLQAMAVYPEPRFALTQALDFLLFPEADWEARARRLRSISRLPWPRHAYLPDYLREFLLRRLSRAERRDLRNAYAALLAGLTDDRRAGTIELPIAVAPERTFRRLFADLLRARSAPGELNDPIFLNILRGGRLGLLDFELPKIAARLLPRGRLWVNARPLLAAALVAAGGGFAFHEGWTRWGAPELRAYWERMAREENARWTVRLTLARDASDFAADFEELLAQRGYRVQVGKDQSGSSSGNTLLYPPGGAKIAGRLTQALRHWTYGTPLEPKEEAKRGAGEIDVRIQAIWTPGAVFYDTFGGAGTLRDRFQEGDGVGPEMVVLPGGAFRMGCLAGDPDCNEDEQPAHAVTIKPFAIGRYEVTFEDYDRFARDTKRKLPDDRGWGRGRRPVIDVTWDDAQAYAIWLSEKTGRRYRLPTEAEWEYAARAGTTTSYWWGNEVGDNHANCLRCGSQWDGKQTGPAGSFAPNPFGLYDTAGNVWEWVEDCYHASYRGAPADGSAWLETGGGDCDRRVFRGGSWYYLPQYLRSADRNWIVTDAAFDNLCFRLARAL